MIAIIRFLNNGNFYNGTFLAEQLAVIKKDKLKKIKLSNFKTQKTFKFSINNIPISMVLHPSEHVILFERFLPSDFIVRSTLKIHYNFSTIILLNDHNQLYSNQRKKKKKNSSIRFVFVSEFWIVFYISVH